MLVTTACGSDDDSSSSSADDENPAASEPVEESAEADDTASTADGASADSDAEPSEATVVRVGVPLDLSGPAAISNIGLSELSAMELALEEVTASGMLGETTIEMIPIDTKGDKQEAVAGVLKLIEQDDVDAIVGFTLTPSFLAAGPQAVEAGLPVIAVGVAAPGITEVGDNVFRIIPQVSSLYAANDAMIAETLGATSAAYLYTSDSETTVGIHEARLAALEDAGIETKSVQSNTTADTDFRAQLTEIQNSGADIMVISGFPGQFAGQFLQAEEIGLDIPVLSTDGSGRNEVLDQAGSAMQCVIYTASWAAQNETGRNPHFVEAVQTELDDEADLYYAAGYDGMWMFSTALADAGSADPDAIVEALNNITDFEGAFGVYEYDDNREPDISGINLQIQDNEVIPWTPDTQCER
ncbi:ABC transporter substrate-binding protein [Ilumatobacter nonamiensis]|uniref:ABC transporter substrate-binding protein n=1 Tax=Ilumatobacter nonamiensis TaxID=467093 RepID=UPI00058C83E3|nr:ABC transporter substrate-binding protein [Ilumatobacter nonamiensis]